MAEEKKGKGEKDEKKQHEKHAKGEGPVVPKQEGEKKPKKGSREKKAPATIQAAQGKAKAKGDHPARLAEAYKANVIPQLMKDFGYKNPMQVPKIEKIVVNMGLGEAISNNKLVEQAQEQMMAISGQKPVITKARKSIANFKLREGQPIGAMVTLRNERMWEFMDRLVNMSIRSCATCPVLPAKDASVGMKPGDTAFTVIPYGPNSIANRRVNIASAALVAE